MVSFREFLGLQVENADAGGRQYPANIQKLLDFERDVFKNFTYQVVTSSKIPCTADIPKQDLNRTTKWLRINDVNCCFVDMIGSTKMSTTLHDKSTAQIYRYFTGTAIKIFRDFNAAYIDVKGDGVFALFDDGLEHAALAAVVTFKTFVEETLSPDVNKKRSLDIGGHYGISRGNLLVRRIGSPKIGDDDQGRNEVWAGKAVNQSAKLAGLAGRDTLLVSNRFHSKLTLEEATMSCGCQNGIFSGKKSDLWTEVNLSGEDHLKIKTGWELKTRWCITHGEETCKILLRHDSDD